jgi:hypothetical protein
LVILGVAALVFAIYAASSMSNMDLFSEWRITFGFF